MKKLFIQLLILAFLLSCERNEKNLFVGDWYKLDEYIVVDSTKNDELGIPVTVPRPPVYHPTGISFIGKDSVKYFGGQWKKHGEIYKYQGENGTFKIINDSVHFYRSDESILTRRKFEFASPDTLKLYKNDTCITFIKFETAIKKYYHLDSIKILEVNGWAPDREYFISSTGQIRYFDEGWDHDSATRRGEISRSIFISIKHRYNWANFMELGDYGGCCDGSELETQFYSKGKLVKTIVDYENSAPMRLIWANTLLINNVKSKLEYPTD